MEVCGAQRVYQVQCWISNSNVHIVAYEWLQLQSVKRHKLQFSFVFSAEICVSEWSKVRIKWVLLFICCFNYTSKQAGMHTHEMRTHKHARVVHAYHKRTPKWKCSLPTNYFIFSSFIFSLWFLFHHTFQSENLHCN